MQLSIKEHRTPIIVTVAGLFVATGLATAPLILADSETDTLAAKNFADIKKLSTTVEGISADTQQQVSAFTNENAGKLSNLENQIQTLNKAATRLNLRQKKIQEPSGEIHSSIAKLSKNMDARVITLEKAVSNLHRKQNTVATASSSENDSAEDSSDNSTDMRLANLEKTVENLLPENSTAISVAGQTGNGDANNDSRIEKLERTVAQLDERQQIIGASGKERLELNVSTNVKNDIRIKRLERSLAQLGKRLDKLEKSTTQGDPVVDQLYEIRDTVDLLLNEISR